MRNSVIKQELEPTGTAGDAVSLLIAEDNKIVRDLLGAIIQRKFPEITIYSAENGRRGFEIFQEHTPSIVITDINMPEMDGIQMAGDIRSISAATKIIVISAYDESDQCEKFGEIGIEGCFPKPITFPNLFAAIEKCLSEVAPAR